MLQELNGIRLVLSIRVGEGQLNELGKDDWPIRQRRRERGGLVNMEALNACVGRGSQRGKSVIEEKKLTGRERRDVQLIRAEASIASA